MTKDPFTLIKGQKKTDPRHIKLDFLIVAIKKDYPHERLVEICWTDNGACYAYMQSGLIINCAGYQKQQREATLC